MSNPHRLQHREFTDVIAGNSEYTFVNKAKPIRILWIRAHVVADANVANRMVKIFFRDITPLNFTEVYSRSYTTAGQTEEHNFIQGSTLWASADGFHEHHSLPDVVLEKDESFRVQLDGGLAGDVFSVIWSWEYAD